MDRLTYRHEDQHGNPTNSISPALKFSYAHREDWVKKVAVRLAAIEDILGDDYDLDRLRELVEADREGRCVVLPAGGYNEKDGENALKSSMNTVFYHNNPVTRYIADAVAEKLVREEAALKGEQDG